MQRHCDSPPIWQRVSTRLEIPIATVGPRRYFAKQAVELGVSSGEMAIVSEEPVVSYERPALSKAYLNPEGAQSNVIRFRLDAPLSLRVTADLCDWLSLTHDRA